MSISFFNINIEDMCLERAKLGWYEFEHEKKC